MNGTSDNGGNGGNDSVVVSWVFVSCFVALLGIGAVLYRRKYGCYKVERPIPRPRAEAVGGSETEEVVDSGPEMEVVEV